MRIEISYKITVKVIAKYNSGDNEEHKYSANLFEWNNQQINWLITRFD